MRSLWLEHGRAAEVIELPRPEPLKGESRVAVTLAGVCATDLALAQGYMGFCGVPGHEFVGRALDGPLQGERVVGEINAGCGTCPRCLGSDPDGLDVRHCESRSVLGILNRHGAFAEQLCLPHQNLLVVPPGVSNEAATFAEPLAAALAITEALPDLAGRRALVIGDGKLGLLCAMALIGAGVKTDLCGRHPERARLLPGLSAFLREPGTESHDLVVEATGHPQVLTQAMQIARPGGTIVLKTTAAEPAALDLAPLVVKELRLAGSRCGRLQTALDALAAGSYPVEALIEHRFALDQGPQALERAAQRGVLKVLVEVSGS